MNEDRNDLVHDNQLRIKGKNGVRGDSPTGQEKSEKDPSQNSGSGITCVQERNHDFQGGNLSEPGGTTVQS